MIRRQKPKEDPPEKNIKFPVDPVKADYLYGLTRKQAKERAAAGWSNDEVGSVSLSTKDIIKKNVFTYFNLIFAVLAVLVCLSGSFRDLTFLPVILLNTIVGIAQEIRAKNVLEKMNMLNAPKTDVVREGKIRSIDSTLLVRDDIVIFHTGNQICADAVVCSGEVRVNESLLTGESEEIVKREGDSLMSGSFIVSGKCYARLVRVGDESYISKLTLKAKAMKDEEQSEMIRSLDKLVKTVGIALIPIGIILFIQGFFISHEGFQGSITSMVAAVIGMIPEGLYLLTTVALALSSVRLAMNKVLLHDMKSIETLARVNVLCVDKTGTITENAMSVQDIVLLNQDQEMDNVKGILSDFVQAMDEDNSTMAAMKQYFTEYRGEKPLKIISFSSANKYSGAVFESGNFVLGAPEFVLGSAYEKYQQRIEEYSAKGYRALIFGKYEEELNGKKLQGQVDPWVLILLMNRIREEASATFAYFSRQGVEVKVISGDNPLTVSETARQAGISGAERYIDARTLKTKEELEEAALNYTVFGRVLPEQKRQLVKALQRKGKTVAMTGDGVNDVLALKDADCSVAMASGSEAAMQAAQVVLLESDFSKMPEVVAEGRRVVNNIQQSASLFLVKNIFSFLLSLVSIIFVFTYPLGPSQISLISMFTIGIPGFFLSLQPNKNVIKGHFLQNVLLKALPAGLTDVLVVAALAIFSQTFGVGGEDLSTASTMLLAIVGFMILFKICKPLNPFRAVICAGCIIGFLASCFLFPGLFGISSMSTKCVMLFVVFSIATEPILRYLTKFNEFVQKVYENREYYKKKILSVKEVLQKAE